MNNIKWEEGAICFATNEQRYANDDAEYIVSNKDKTVSFNSSRAISSHDFQLNEIRTGDCIEASELDTEQKYNDAVEVFELFGFEPYLNCDMDKSEFIKQALNYGEGLIADDELDLVIDYNEVNDISQKIRKITYPQLMAIGKLKRLELERSAPKIAPDLTPDLVNNQEVKMQKNKPVVAQVMIDLTERMEIGIKTYGEALRVNNGRDALQDAYEEALDLACYLKQAMIERDSREDE